MRLRTMQAGPVMQMPVSSSSSSRPVYVPLALLDGWIHTVAVVNPLTRVIESGRGFISGRPTEVAEAFLVSPLLACSSSGRSAACARPSARARRGWRGAILA